MNMIQKFRARQRDMKALSTLISTSLERAQRDGASYAGAQHLILSSLEMSDGTTERVFGELQMTGALFAAAVATQEAQALLDLGVAPELAESAPPEGAGTGKYGKADATFEAALEHIHDVHNEHADYRPLVGAHVLAGAASIDRGVTARALREMGIDRAVLIAAARREFVL